MDKKYYIDEASVYKLIQDTFNDNISDGKIKFSIGYYFLDDNGASGGFSRRFAQQNGRFDVKKTLDDDTLLLEDKSFVPMNIPSLNGSFLAHKTIKEVNFNPTIEFLVYAEDIKTFALIEDVLKQVRAKLIQYQTSAIISYRNLDNLSDKTRIDELFKVIMMAGEISYGQLVPVAGKHYLSMSIDLAIEITDIGEYANQERIYLSVPSVNNGDYVEITEAIAWNYGVGIDLESSQMLNDHDVLSANYDKTRVIRSVPKTTAWSYAMGVQMNFKNPILRKIFIDSRKPNQITSNEVWMLKSEMTVLNPETQAYEVDSELSIIDERVYLETKAPARELSQGEKIIYSLQLTPEWAKEV
ncbi:MAG: hypothetical protein RBQ97_07525 [Acholeplasma sp.]|nr:hypothetical protein [Acholeplasma sp.]